MKPKITETELNQEFKKLGFINGLAYRIIGRKYNITAHGVEVKTSKMRKAGKLIKLGGRTLKMLNIEELKTLFDDNRDKEENLKAAMGNGLTKEEAEANYIKWKDSYMDGTIKPESHVKGLYVQPIKENNPSEGNSSSQNKSALESTIHSQETGSKEELKLKPYERELVGEFVKKHSSEPQIKEVINPEIVFVDEPHGKKLNSINPTTLKPVTMEGQNSVYTFNKCGVKVNTLGDTTITPELLQEQQEALELWNLHYKELG